MPASFAAAKKDEKLLITPWYCHSLLSVKLKWSPKKCVSTTAAEADITLCPLDIRERGVFVKMVAS